ncbi:MAG: toprim domain-containing protein [Maritimibacter sp.]|nr:toprim domain-containing protein [Maritimibacter sp.]
MRDARALTETLGGRWYQSYGTAPCPVCQPERERDQNALTIAQGRGVQILLHCKKSGCDFREIIRAAGISGRRPVFLSRDVPSSRDQTRRTIAATREGQAKAVWRETLPLAGTLADTYLRSRAITCSPPKTLRFHPACWHMSSHRLPAMVGLVEGGGGFAIHRTWLASDGSGKAAVNPDKAMLGSVAGGAVRLTIGPGPLVVSEGIETALSLASGLLNGPAHIWAALSASGMAGLKLPPCPHKLIVASDGDSTGQRVAGKLAERAQTMGWEVSLLQAPDGLDWNDYLKMEGITNENP